MAEQARDEPEYWEIRLGKSGRTLWVGGAAPTDPPNQDPHFQNRSRRYTRADRRFLPTVVVVWGYGEPQSSFLRDYGVQTPRAVKVAGERGWDAQREGAWAKEIALSRSVPMALRQVETAARRDASAVGWQAIDDLGG